MRLTRRFREYRHAGALESIARSFLDLFPELEGLDFELDLLPSRTYILGLTEQDRDPPRIRLRPARPTNKTLTQTIPHEYMHLLQYPLRLIPQGERSCDLYAMARAGERFRSSPNYLEVPKRTYDDWDHWAPVSSHLAREAIRQREQGRRHYIVWWEETFRRHVEAVRMEDEDGEPWEWAWSPAIEGGSAFESPTEA
jgi:hypothetical protein